MFKFHIIAFRKIITLGYTNNKDKTKYIIPINFVTLNSDHPVNIYSILI